MHAEDTAGAPSSAGELSVARLRQTRERIECVAARQGKARHIPIARVALALMQAADMT